LSDAHASATAMSTHSSAILSFGFIELLLPLIAETYISRYLPA
jgi:hypothetical protein